MARLFEPITGERTVAEVREELVTRHRKTSADGREALEQQQSLVAGYWRGTSHPVSNSSGWGTAMKRVSAADGRQPMAEVVNQCATVERLLDALAWAESTLLPEIEPRVLLVHPGTSSGGPVPTLDAAGIPVPDHDLVLAAGTKVWVFEVSDIASSRDNNGKNKKDSETLRATLRLRSDVRAFLVTSPERAEALSKRLAALGSEEVEVMRRSAEPGRTAIFELAYI